MLDSSEAETPLKIRWKLLKYCLRMLEYHDTTTILRHPSQSTITADELFDFYNGTTSVKLGSATK